MKRGLLLIDRGSREREAEEELEIICKKVKERGNYDFSEFCFLEVVPPFIEDGMDKCLKKNVNEMTIVPYFLYPGKKIKAAVNESIGFQEKTDVKLRITKPMSMHKTMIELVDNRITTALNENSVNLPKNTVDVLVIGHGSKDPNARRSMEYVIDGIKPTYRNVSFCFLEIEEPNIKQGIIKCKNESPEVLVVVFYFLHEGAHVKRDIYEDLNPALEEANLQKVLITKHIGTDDKMVDLIIERAKEVEVAN